MLQLLKSDNDAELEFAKALEIEPENLDFMYALFDFYFKRSQYLKAKGIAEKMVRAAPGLPEVKELLNIVSDRIGSRD